MSEIKSFKIDVPQEEVDRLKRKLQDTRLPGREIVPGAGDTLGKSILNGEKVLKKNERLISDFRPFI